jgi:hypothetical protein
MFGVSLLSLTGCPAEETPPPAPPPVPAPPPAPPPKPAVMDVAGLNAAREANVGQTVTVKGILGTVTKKEANIEVNVMAADAPDADWIRCTTTDLSMEADLMALAPKSEVTVAGVVDAAPVDGKTNLTACAPAEAKGGKAKAGEDGKAGKEKAGKQKAH